MALSRAGTDRAWHTDTYSLAAEETTCLASCMGSHPMSWGQTARLQPTRHSQLSKAVARNGELDLSWMHQAEGENKAVSR